MFQVAKLIILSLLTTSAILLVFFMLLGKCSSWVDRYYGVCIRRLLKHPLEYTRNDGTDAREQSYERIHPTYSLQSICQRHQPSKLGGVARHEPTRLCKPIGHQQEQADTKYPSNNVERFPHLLLFLLRHIVNKLRRRVNQSGKEPH
jgi:hypothetical protein